MTQRVWAVSEGEQYHIPWIIHAVFSDKDSALSYAQELVELNEPVRWPNVYLWQFTVNVPGGVPVELATVGASK